MIFLILLFVLVWVVPIKANRICNQREQSRFLKFIASLVVVIGHQAAYYGINNEIFMKETSLGALCVSFFLFMSGYGLQYGFLKNKQTLSDDWLKIRMVKLIVPALTAMFLYVGAELVVGKEVDWRNLFIYWFLSDINLRYGWYVSEIIALYVGFYFVYKYLSVKYAIWELCAIISIVVFIMVITECPIWFILGLPCFIMGLLLAHYEVAVNNRFFSFTGMQLKVVMSFVVLLFGCLKNFGEIQQFAPFFNKWRYMFFSLFAYNILFIIIISYILMRLPICKVMNNNRGGYFYEVYLVQGAALLICRKCFADDILFVLLGLFFTLLVAKGMSFINDRIISNI